MTKFPIDNHSIDLPKIFYDQPTRLLLGKNPRDSNRLPHVLNPVFKPVSFHAHKSDPNPFSIMNLISNEFSNTIDFNQNIKYSKNYSKEFFKRNWMSYSIYSILNIFGKKISLFIDLFLINKLPRAKEWRWCGCY